VEIENGGWMEMEMENEEWMFEGYVFKSQESTSQYNWASLSAVGTVRPDRLISARLRRKFSIFQQPSPICFTTRSSTGYHGIYGKAGATLLR
jgi:hypothetical protein